jgi:hypothetical protein
MRPGEITQEYSIKRVFLLNSEGCTLSGEFSKKKPEVGTIIIEIFKPVP